jgi:hypothetical protein
MPPKSSPTDDLEALVDEIDNLVLDRVRSAVPAEVDQRLARLNADLQAQHASLEREMRSSQSAQAEVEMWFPNRYPRGVTVAHRGGTWRCVATQGAEAAHEPNPDSPVWLGVTVGICEMKARKISVGKGELIARLSNGSELKVDIPLPKLTMRGTHNSDQSYSELDVVSKEGGSFVAKHDNPGACPGPGWQMMAARGKSATLDIAQVREIKHWLETRANATSFAERLADGLSVDLFDVIREHPDRCRSELGYRAFATDLASALVRRVSRTVAPERVRADASAVLFMAMLHTREMLHKIFIWGKERAQPPAPEKGFSQRHATSDEIEGQVLIVELHCLGQLLEALPGALGSRDRSQRLLAYTEAYHTRLLAADGMLETRHFEQEVAEIQRLPLPYDAVYDSAKGSEGNAFAMAVAKDLAPLLALDDETVVKANVMMRKIYLPSAA